MMLLLPLIMHICRADSLSDPYLRLLVPAVLNSLSICAVLLNMVLVSF